MLHSPSGGKLDDAARIGLVATLHMLQDLTKSYPAVDRGHRFHTTGVSEIGIWYTIPVDVAPSSVHAGGSSGSAPDVVTATDAAATAVARGKGVGTSVNDGGHVGTFTGASSSDTTKLEEPGAI